MIQEALIITTGLGLLTCVVSPLAGALGVMVDNLWSVRPPDLGLAEMTARREAWTTWLAIPGLAYILSIVTNLGTSIIDQHGFISPPAWMVLGGGFFALEVVAIVIMSRSGRRRSEWESLADWTLLWIEIDRRRKDPAASPPQWLSEAREQASRIDAKRTRLGDLRRRAHNLLGVADLDWTAAPRYGLFRYANRRRRVRVSIFVAVKWFFVSRWSWFFVAAGAVTITSLTWLTVAYSDHIVRSILAGVLFVFVVFILAYAKSRASLIYYARIHAQKIEARDRCLSAIRDCETSSVPRRSNRWLEALLGRLRG